MRQINSIVIHCAATPNGRPVDIKEIDAWHAARGFHRSEAARAKLNPDLQAVGYHYVINVDGITMQGRDLEEIGAHVAGSNAKSVGVCMVGTDKFSAAQWHSLKAVAKTLKGLYPGARFLGHRDYSPDLNGDGIVESWEWTKTCPGFSVAAWQQRGMEPDPAEVLS